METRTWFEVQRGGNSSSFETQQEAEAYLVEMGNGHPGNEFMSAENRVYWAKAAACYSIVKVTRTEEVVVPAYAA